MLWKAVPTKSVVIVVAILVGVGGATAAAAAVGGGTTNTSASSHSHEQSPPSPNTSHGPTNGASTSAAPHTPAPTITSGTSKRQGHGPNIHALPGLCRAQIASAGHPNAHSVVPTINCSGVTPAGHTASDSASTSSEATSHGTSNSAPAGGSHGGASSNGHGRP